MRPRTLLVLFLLVAGLGAFIWFVERDLPGSDERAELEKRLLAVEPEEITELIIEREGASAHLVRPASDEAESETGDEDPAAVKRRWRLLEPFDTRADNSTADRLAETLSSLEKVRSLEEVDPKAVGLDSPRARVTVRTPDGESVVRVGAEIPASSNMIVATDAGTFVVAATVWSTLETAPGDWRSKTLFPLHRGAVERVELSSAEETLALVRRDETFWIESPVEDLAESERVDELLDAMFGTEISAFLDRPELSAEEMGLAPAARRLTVNLTGHDQPVVLELGAPAAGGEGDRYARIDDQVVRIGDDLDEAIADPPMEWQARAWTALEVYEIDSFRAVDGSGELLLERAGADWSRDGVKVSYSPISDFLYALAGAAGERVIDRAEAERLGADLGDPALELILKGSTAEESLSLHDADGSGIAAREGRAYLLVLSAGTVEDLRLKLQAIRDEPRLGADDEEKEEG